MAHESIHAIITPNSVRRSRTGAVLAQVLGESGLELTGACFSGAPEAPGVVFRLSGEDAVARIAEIAGSEDAVGSVRGRFGAADDPVLEISNALPTDLVHRIEGPGERTLVLLKPDNFESPSIRPGALLDHFGRTGLRLAAMKVHHMSVAEGEKFYAPVLPVLEEAFVSSHGKAACEFLDAEFDESLDAHERERIAQCVGPVMGRRRWETLVEFMTGFRPSDVGESDSDGDGEKERPGTRKCLALVYEGENAVERIRSILGPTDPAKAPDGTVRREFGRALMINAAHASDSPANAAREMEIIRMSENPLVINDSAISPMPVPSDGQPSKNGKSFL